MLNTLNNFLLLFCFLSEEGKLTTSQDPSCKYVVEENTEVAEEVPSGLQPTNTSPEQR